MRAPGWAARCAISATRLLVAREALHGGDGVVEAAGADALLDRPRAVGVEARDLHVGGLVGVGEVDAGDVALDAAEDGDHAVLLADVVLVLAPAPRRDAGHPGEAQDAEQSQDPAQPQVAAGLAWRVAHGL